MHENFFIKKKFYILNSNKRNKINKKNAKKI